ncbi:uncharacterized protein LOC143213822 isoform X1 [Lasioglossum baleicum]|uniref:uncharacterized protein LOC143213822 isoform X1 n=1 Tax=Lasioglossum baleicum TaxID=434251 RepID=UPI003FCDA77A
MLLWPYQSNLTLTIKSSKSFDETGSGYSCFKHICKMKSTEDVRFMASVAAFIVGFAAIHVGWQHIQQTNVPPEKIQPHPFVRLYRRMVKPVEK